MFAALVAVWALAAPPAHGGLVAAVSVESDGSNTFTNLDMLMVDPLDPSRAFPLPAGTNNAAALEQSVSLSGDGRRLAFARRGVISPGYWMLDRQSGTVAQLPTPGGAGISSAADASLSPNGRRNAYATTPNTNGQPMIAVLVDTSAFPGGPFPEQGRPTASIAFSDSKARIPRPTGRPAITDSGKIAWTWSGGLADDDPGGIAIAPATGTPKVVSFKPKSLGGTLKGISDPAFVPTTTAGTDELTFTSRPTTGGPSLGRVRMDFNPTFDALSLPGLSFVANRDELFPVWTPSGRYLAYLELGESDSSGRVPSRRARIKVYDTQTQQLVLPEGRSVGFVESADSLAIAELPSIVNRFTISGGGATLNAALLGPSTVGIIVQRITGTQTVLGRRVPRLQPVGRVPLGRRAKGRNRIPWNGKVNGRRLRPGLYQITLRALKGARVTDLSKPQRLRIRRS